MIDEIQIIQSGGIPIYSYNKSETDDNQNLLQAGFFTAVVSFVDEMNNGEMRMIVLQKKSFLLKKAQGYTMIFGAEAEEDFNDILSYETTLNSASTRFSEILSSFSLDIVPGALEEYDVPLLEMDEWFRGEQLIPDDKPFDAAGFRGQINSFVFKSVGYTPGECNIGRAERFRRLSFGLVFIAISLMLHVIMNTLGVNPFYKLLLVIPNSLGFLGLFQYFYRFCTTNARNQTYTMS